MVIVTGSGDYMYTTLSGMSVCLFVCFWGFLRSGNRYCFSILLALVYYYEFDLKLFILHFTPCYISIVTLCMMAGRTVAEMPVNTVMKGQ